MEELYLFMFNDFVISKLGQMSKKKNTTTHSTTLFLTGLLI